MTTEPYTLSPINSSDFPALAAAEALAYADPYTPIVFLHIAEPTFHASPNPHEAAIVALAEKQRAAHESDPNSMWIKAVETSTGKIVGGALWRVWYENPCQGERTLPGPGSWEGMGDRAEFAKRYFAANRKAWWRYCARPQVFLQTCFVHPKFRRMGIGKKLMAWGLQKADEEKLPLFTFATDMGGKLYEWSGFKPVAEVEIDLSTPDPSEEWQEMQRMYPPLRTTVMMRPVKSEEEVRN